MDAFADGAARGVSARWMSARASREDGILAPKVVSLCDPVTSGARGEGGGSGRRIVSGPGQKREIRGW